MPLSVLFAPADTGWDYPPSMNGLLTALQEKVSLPREKIRVLAPAVVILALAVVGNAPLVWGQFTGEDEALQLWYSSRILENLHHLGFANSIRSIVGIFLSVQHPPLRYILSLPGLILFPHTDLGVRLVSILLSLYMTWQAMRLGEEIGGWATGICTGLLLAVSGVYTWTSMAFGWSLIAVMMIASIRLLRKSSLDLEEAEGRSALRRVSLYTFAAFLINTSCILLFASTLALFAFLNRRRLRRFVWVSAPFLLLFGLYYVFFLAIVPLYYLKTAGNALLAGQYAHHVGRAHTYLNYRSLLANLEGLNAYIFPFVSWLLLAGAVIYLSRNNRRVLFWLAPFALTWSFLLSENTQSYFLLVFISILAFGVHFLFTRIGKRNALAFCLILSVGMGSWSYLLFQRSYTELGYPSRLLEMIWSRADRKHNVVVPYQAIGRDLDELVGPRGLFIHNIWGCFTMFYYTDNPLLVHHSRYAGALGSSSYPTAYDRVGKCYRLRFIPSPRLKAIVTAENLCPSDAKLARTYPGSPIKLYILE